MTDQKDASNGSICAFSRSIPNPDAFPTIGVPVAARVLDVSRRTGYAAAERGEWPVIRVGRSIRVRTREFLAQYGLLDESDAGTSA